MTAREDGKSTIIENEPQMLLASETEGMCIRKELVHKQTANLFSEVNCESELQIRSVLSPPTGVPPCLPQGLRAGPGGSPHMLRRVRG